MPAVCRAHDYKGAVRLEGILRLIRVKDPLPETAVDGNQFVFTLPRELLRGEAAVPGTAEIQNHSCTTHPVLVEIVYFILTQKQRAGNCELVFFSIVFIRTLWYIEKNKSALPVNGRRHCS